MTQVLEYKSVTEPDYIYYVKIKQDNGMHYCRLEEYVEKSDRLDYCSPDGTDIIAKYYEFKNGLNFDLTTVIGDFLNLVTISVKGKFGNILRYTKNYKDHPFFLGHKFEWNENPTAETRYIYRTGLIRDGACVYLNDMLKRCQFALDDFETLRELFGVQITCDICYKSEKPIKDFNNSK